MAVESLAHFLEDQLSQLSRDDSGRPFLENIYEKVQSYLELSEYSSPKQKGGLLNSGEHISEYFKAARKGPYLQINEVTNLLGRPRLSENCLRYGEKLINRIEHHGNESVAHLCLPVRAWNTLSRADIDTITKLRERLSSGDLRVVLRNFGNQSFRWVINSVADFDSEVAKVNSSS